MPIYEFGKSGINRLETTTFSLAGFHERRDLQRLLRENVDVISPDTLVISEEFGKWEDARRRIDLLGIDKAANLVVIELKRTEDGGHMDLQSVRYASMVSKMTFDQAVEEFGQYLRQLNRNDVDPREKILEFLEAEEIEEGNFAQDVRIVLASAEFSKEVTTTVMWLIDHDIDIRCVRLRPYNFEGRVLVDVETIIPLPEAAGYQVQVREKARKERESRISNADFTRFDVQFEGARQSSMWKRNAIFFVCKNLCAHRVGPEEIAALFDWRMNVWYAVDGVVDALEFKQLATKRALADGSVFNSRRWFCDDGELVHANEKTYAFSNQWGGDRWHKAMSILKAKFSQFKIDFSPTKGSE
jgi:hypothetical protein